MWFSRLYTLDQLIFLSPFFPDSFLFWSISIDDHVMCPYGLWWESLFFLEIREIVDFLTHYWSQEFILIDRSSSFWNQDFKVYIPHDRDISLIFHWTSDQLIVSGSLWDEESGIRSLEFEENQDFWPNYKKWNGSAIGELFKS